MHVAQVFGLLDMQEQVEAALANMALTLESSSASNILADFTQLAAMIRQEVTCVPTLPWQCYERGLAKEYVTGGPGTMELVVLLLSHVPPSIFPDVIHLHGADSLSSRLQRNFECACV